MPMSASQYWLKPLLKPIASSESGRHPKKTCEDRANRENNQRIGHHWWRFMQMMLGVMISTAFAEEGHEHLTEHIKCGHSCPGKAEQPQERMPGREGLPENL